MTQKTTGQLADYIRSARLKLQLGNRELSRQAGINSAALSRLEQGKITSPRPDTLQALASALSVPLADLFTLAGYVVPAELPSIELYLQIRYGHLDAEKRMAIAQCVREHAEPQR